MAFSNILSHQFVKSFEILFAQILPEFLVISRYKIIIYQSTAGYFNGHLPVLFAVEILNLLNFVLQLTRHLINLCALHIQMIYLVSPASYGASFAFSFFAFVRIGAIAFL